MTRATLDAPRAAAAIRLQFPDLRATDVRLLGEGYDSTAFAVDDRWVFRFPKREDVEAQLHLEARVLPHIAGVSPLDVPVFRFIGRPSAAFPRHFAGYRKLPGVPASGLSPDPARLDGWAPVLADFLSRLHAFSVDEAAGLGVPQSDIVVLTAELQADAIADLDSVERVVTDRRRLSAWRAQFEEGVPGASGYEAAALVHGDFAAEHVLCDATGTLTGVIDWSDIVITDPALDFAGLFHWGGPALVDAVLRTYAGSPDAAALRRARFLAACRGAADVTFGLETDRADFIAAGLAALRRCAD